MSPPLRRCRVFPPCCAGGTAPVARRSRFHGALGLGHALRPGTRVSLRRCRGFTLLELMIVVAIIALATAGVSLALRDGGEASLEREALRLSALLESARAQSRASGVPVLWRSTGGGFEFIGVAPRPAAGADDLSGARDWLSPDTRVLITRPAGASALVLGPDPLIAAQALQLVQGERRLLLGTDGLGPFAVLADEGAP